MAKAVKPGSQVKPAMVAGKAAVSRTPVKQSPPAPASAAPAPVPAVAAKAGAETSRPVKPAVVPQIETSTVAAAAAPAIEEAKIMNETVKKTVAETTERAKAAFGDMNERTKDAMTKGNKFVEDMNEFAKGNIEALVESSKIAAKGAEDIARYSADYGRKTIEQANENAKKFAGVKSPTELFQLQSEIAKGAVEAMVAETSKFTESYLKLLGDIAQPISNRVAVGVEKVKLAA